MLSLFSAQNGGNYENGNIASGTGDRATSHRVNVIAPNNHDGYARGRHELKIFIDGNMSSQVIDSLVMQTLAIIRTLVDK